MANTINTRIVLRNDELAAWEASTKALLSGEVALARTTDGKVELRVGNGDKFNNALRLKLSADQIEGLNEQMNTLSAAHHEVTAFADLEAITDANGGDTGVVKTVIAGTGDATKYSYTAYVFDSQITSATKPNGTWVAMDGNYSADNVYFDSDLTAAGSYDKVGNVAVNTTVATTGKSLSEVMQKIFTKELSAGIKTNPSASGAALSAKVNGAGSLVKASQSYEYGTYLTDIAYSGATFSAGAYTYSNPSITPTSWATTATNSVTVTDGGTGKAGTLETVVIGDKGADTDNAVLSAYKTVTSVKITTTATYPADTLSAKTNLGNINSAATDESYADVCIPGGTKSTTSGEFTGYRKYFWGYRTTAEGALDVTALTSGNIRDDIHAQSGKAFPSTTEAAKTTNFSLPAGGIKQIIFACPHGAVTKKIVVYNNSSLGSKLDFDNANARVENAVNVEGANGYTAVAYDIWYVTFPAQLGVATDLAITWA